MPATWPAWLPLREQYIAAWRTWNEVLDGTFYDVGGLSAAEHRQLAAHRAPEGALVVVHPRSAGRELRILTPRAFVDEQSRAGAETVSTIAIAGVGSSALGTAALARDVADALERPVAGIVSGLGMADVLSEAAGGWFVFGAHNAVRDYWARVFDRFELADHVRDDASHHDMRATFAELDDGGERFIYGSPDSTALLYLLLKLPGRIHLLVGHSKGNYSIVNALEGWQRASAPPGGTVDEDLCVVTLGAVIRFPAAFRNVHQFIGSIDLLGMLNSRPGLACTTVPGTWHSLNPALPAHLPVPTVLERAPIAA